MAQSRLVGRRGRRHSPAPAARGGASITSNSDRYRRRQALFINERRRNAPQRCHRELQSFQIFFNIIAAILRHVVHVTAGCSSLIAEHVWVDHLLDRRRFPFTVGGYCRCRRKDAGTLRSAFALTLPARNDAGRLRALRRRRASTPRCTTPPWDTSSQSRPGTWSSDSRGPLSPRTHRRPWWWRTLPWWGTLLRMLPML